MAYALFADSGTEIVVGGSYLLDAGTRVEFRHAVGNGEPYPGFINAHDHLFLNHYPRLGSPPYPNAYDWGRDLHSRYADEIRRLSKLPRPDAFLFGALKNLLGGVTTVVHHDRWDPSLGIRLPVRVARVRVAHSLGFENDLAAAIRGDAETRDRPLSMHLAEGTDAVAAAEVTEAHRRGLLDRSFLAVHLVGVSGNDLSLLAASGAAVIWCPTSNTFLFGRTAPAELFTKGLDILLGTDSLLTGAGTMLAELRAARRTGLLNDQRLLHAVGRVAAARLALPEPALEPGRPADLVFLRRPPGDARPADVTLVIVAGLPRLGDEHHASLFDYCGVPVEALDVGGVSKIVASPLATVARRVFELSPECRRVLDE